MAAELPKQEKTNITLVWEDSKVHEGKRVLVKHKTGVNSAF